MKRYKRLAVDGTADTETVSELLKGSVEQPKHVDGIYVIEATGTKQNDAVLLGYVEQDKVLESDCRIWLSQAATPLRIAVGWIQLDIDLPAGRALDVGHKSGGTASNFVFVAQYEVTR